jgi:hypothetical protein
MHLVKDAIALDASLVPLYRLMALTCDAEVGLGAAPSGIGPSGGVVGGDAAIAEADRVLNAHFGKSGSSEAVSHSTTEPATAPGSPMSTAEAERILSAHFRR